MFPPRPPGARPKGGADDGGLLNRGVLFRDHRYWGFLKKLPCWKRLFFSENVPIIGIIISLCVGPVLWCVNTLNFFKVSLCVGSVWSFQSPLVCGRHNVVWEDFELFRFSWVRVLYFQKKIPVLERLIIFEKIPIPVGIFPCTEEIVFFGKKSLCCL